MAAGTTESTEGRADAVLLSSGAWLSLLGRRGSARSGGWGGWGAGVPDAPTMLVRYVVSSGI